MKPLWNLSWYANQVHKFIGDNVYTKVGQKEKLSKVYIEDLVEIPFNIFPWWVIQQSPSLNKRKKERKKRVFWILNIFVAMGKKKHKFWTLDALTSNK